MNDKYHMASLEKFLDEIDTFDGPIEDLLETVSTEYIIQLYNRFHYLTATINKKHQVRFGEVLKEELRSRLKCDILEDKYKLEVVIIIGD